MKIIYKGSTFDSPELTKVLDKYDLIILRQAVICQSKREHVTLAPEFARVYKQKVQELYEIFDSNMDINIRVESRK